MAFSSAVFLFCFLPAVLILYYCPIFRGRNFRNALLLTASLLFYAWGETLFVFVMIFSVAANFLLALAMEKAAGRRKLFLKVSVAWNLLLLFAFKYLSFFLDNFSRLVPSLNFPRIHIALPIGISFFTFQIMSYVFDVYYGKARVQRNFFDLALYISLFPQLIAGPIVRYAAIENQIRNRTESPALFAGGARRFVIGLAKKCLIADFAAAAADYAFGAEISALTGSVAWLGAFCYSIQIYFDFSGYSDMAIGLGRMFGFQFEENFNYPYAAESVTDFWRRWHISLSSWFRDYLYIPLGGSRRSRGRSLLNMAAVWIFTGVWHGANWTFWLWGIYYFVLLAAEKSLATGRFPGSRAARILRRIVTLLLVMLGWVLFRSESPGAAFAYIGKMFSPENFLGGISAAGQCGAFLLLSAVLSLPVLKKIGERLLGTGGTTAAAFARVLADAGLLFLLFLCAAAVLGGAYSPFIYFNF